MTERTTIRRHQRQARLMTVQPPPMTVQPPQWQPGLLALDAHDADRDTTCHQCGLRILTGQRIARLMDGRWVHVSLCAEAASMGRHPQLGTPGMPD